MGVMGWDGMGWGQLGAPNHGGMGSTGSTQLWSSTMGVMGWDGVNWEHPTMGRWDGFNWEHPTVTMGSHHGDNGMGWGQLGAPNHGVPP